MRVSSEQEAESSQPLSFYLPDKVLTEAGTRRKTLFDYIRFSFDV
jgi:hypothetical protein